MGRINYAYDAFNAGELSPFLDGRSLQKVEPAQRGVKTALNMQAMVEGPLVRRGGSEYVAEVADSSKLHRAVRFEFSEEQAYVLEFGDQTMRVFKDGGQVANGATPVEVATPWSSDDLRDLYFTQSADVLFVTHPDYQPRTITRTSHVDWTLDVYANTDGPWQDANAESSYTFALGATTGSNVSLTVAGYASAEAGPFASTDVGRQVRIKAGGSWTWAEVVTYSNASLVYVDLGDRTAGGTGATSDWRLGAWSETTGWPHCCTIHQGRMAFGATDTQPQTLWLTRSDDYYDHSPTDADGTVVDSHAITRTLGAGEVNTIRGLVGADYLVVLTEGGEYRVTASSDGVLAPDDCKARLDSFMGAANIQPVWVGKDTLAVQRHGKKVYGLRYSFESDGLVPTAMNQLARHITEAGIVEMAYQREPDLGVWMVREDGVLLHMAFDPVQKVVGWTRHILGGEYDGGDAVVESVAVVPGDGRDEVWVIVKRTIDGSTVRYVERISQYVLDEDERQEDMIYFDSSLEYDGRNTTSGATFSLTGGGTWAVGSSAAMTASGHTPWTASSVGWVYALQPPAQDEYDITETEYRVELTGVTSSNAATVELLDAIPATLQSNATANWARHVSSVTGLDHLEGESVSLLVDGAMQPDATVTSGAATLKYRGCVVLAGLKYGTYMAPRRHDYGHRGGTAEGRDKKYTDVYVRVWRSLGVKIGKDLDSLLWARGRPATTPMGQAPPLHTGLIRADIDSGWALEQDIYVFTDQGYPLMVQAIYAETDVT